MKTVKKKFYPFSAKLVRKLKKHRIYGKTVKAYDRLKTTDKELKKKYDTLDSCFVFHLTKEGANYWWDMQYKISGESV